MCNKIKCSYHHSIPAFSTDLFGDSFTGRKRRVKIRVSSQLEEGTCLPCHPRGEEETEWHKCPTQCKKKKREEHCNPVEKGEGRKFRIAGREWGKKKQIQRFPIKLYIFGMKIDFLKSRHFWIFHLWGIPDRLPTQIGLLCFNFLLFFAI